MLEPLPSEKKSMWRREMEWLLCVSDHIVELIPSWQTFPDGSKLEVVQILVLISALTLVVLKKLNLNLVKYCVVAGEENKQLFEF